MKLFFSIVSICLSLLVSGVACADTHPLVDLRGFWVIDPGQSESYEDKFAKIDKHRETKFRFGLGGGSGRPAIGPRTGKGGGRDEQFGMMQQILGAKALHIDGYGDVAVTYDGKLTRYLAPNPNGRVFSASGKELVGDEFGLTLSYWDDAVPCRRDHHGVGRKVNRTLSPHRSSDELDRTGLGRTPRSRCGSMVPDLSTSPGLITFKNYTHPDGLYS